MDNKDIDVIDTIDANIDIEKIIINKHDINLVWQYLKKQKTIIAKVFFLHYYMDYSIKDISLALNINESNVKNYLYRTLKKLNSLMEGKGE